MGLYATPTDFTDRDFTALRERIHLLARAVFTDWTDENIATFSQIIAESQAFIGGTLTFYQGNNLGEMRWGTAQQRRSLVNLAKLIGFVPATNKAATADEQITINSGGTGKVHIGAGSVFSTLETSNPIQFQSLVDLDFDAGANPRTKSVTIEHSQPQEDQFPSTGGAGQRSRLGVAPYIDGSASVGAANGAYSQVSDFLDSGPTDLHYMVEIDQNDRATVIFGDGVSGAIPTGTITIDYKTGGGEAGNIDAGLINRCLQSFADEFGSPVTIAVTNPAKASGGATRQTTRQIQKLAPLSLRALQRSIAREDYEINTLKLSQVARALFLTSNEDPGVPENTGILFPIPFGGGLPSQELKDLIFTQLTEVFPCPTTFTVLVQNPQFLTLNFSAVVFLRSGVKAADARSAVETALADFFKISNDDNTPNENVDFGFNYKNALGQPAGSIPFSDLFNVVRDVPELRKIGDGPADFLVNSARRDVVLTTRSFPVLGTVSLINGDTGQPL